jgi:hypothetical protein
MQTVFYILGSIAAIVIILSVALLATRALVLMSRIEDTRRDFSEMISETELSLQHANRLLVRLQEAADRLRHTLDHVEEVVGMLKPSSAVGEIIAGARRVISGRRQPPTKTVE